MKLPQIATSGGPLLVVSRSALRNFVRRAIRRLPDEYIGTMWGRRARGAKQLLICDIQPVDHEATPANITDWANLRVRFTATAAA